MTQHIRLIFDVEIAHSTEPNDVLDHVAGLLLADPADLFPEILVVDAWEWEMLPDD